LHRIHSIRPETHTVLHTVNITSKHLHKHTRVLTSGLLTMPENLIQEFKFIWDINHRNSRSLAFRIVDTVEMGITPPILIPPPLYLEVAGGTTLHML